MCSMKRLPSGLSAKDPLGYSHWQPASIGARRAERERGEPDGADRCR
jgi:hypothetical protein